MPQLSSDWPFHWPRNKPHEGLILNHHLGWSLTQGCSILPFQWSRAKDVLTLPFWWSRAKDVLQFQKPAHSLMITALVDLSLAALSQLFYQAVIPGFVMFAVLKIFVSPARLLAAWVSVSQGCLVHIWTHRAHEHGLEDWCKADLFLGFPFNQPTAFPTHKS